MSYRGAPPALGTIRTSLTSFGQRWREKIDEWDDKEKGRSEKRHAQTFWSDLLRQFGVIPERISLFEKEAVRASTGNEGSIDVFWSSVFLGEAKSVGRNLDDAEEQAMDYLAGGSIGSHEWPRYVLVTDFDRLRITKQGDDPFTVEFPIQDIADHTDQLAFLAGYETISKKEEKDASVEAAKIMARLYEAMLGDDSDTEVGDAAPTAPEDEDATIHRVSVFLTRILFLLYGDDAGLWRDDLFYEFLLRNTRDDGSDLGVQIKHLFEVLNTPPEKRHARLDPLLAQFRYVNGSLFTDENELEYFDGDMRTALLEACRFRWTRISPAVFGSMFQLVKSKEARRGQGEHYTSESNILKTIEPMFLEELRSEAARLVRNKSTSLKVLRQFRTNLSRHIFLDPASGCGNFLVVAYRELRTIETSIIVAIRERERLTTAAFDVSLETQVTIDQFHGIEINWWPAKIAETAMFLVDHQANRELAQALGDAPDRLPIEITAHIHHLNALSVPWSTLIPETLVVLEKDNQGRLVIDSDTGEPKVDKENSGKTYVFGNPPFIGQGKKTDEQTRDLKKVWKDDYNGYLDYVTGWHAQALDLFSDERLGEFGFVTTNSIVQGAQVPFLFGPIAEKRWRIKCAHRTFEWESEAPGKAAVHCVIIDFTRDSGVAQQLWDYATPKSDPQRQSVSQRVNAYLVDGPWVLIKAMPSQPLSSQLPPLDYGSKPSDGGGLIVEKRDHHEVVADPIAAKYLREYRMGNELIHNLDRWCLWLADEDFDPRDISRSEILRSRLEKVRSARLASPKKATQADAERPRFFQEIRQPETDYLAVPAVFSEERRYMTAGHLKKEVIAGNKLFTAEDPDGVLFALISSSMFITWQKTIGGRLESRPNFANTLTWNTFPVPEMSREQRKRIVAAGEKVLSVRASFPNRSLADLYVPLGMDAKLISAHNALDVQVDKLFGARRRLTRESDRLEFLFRSYATLTAAADRETSSA